MRRALAFLTPLGGSRLCPTGARSRGSRSPAGPSGSPSVACGGAPSGSGRRRWRRRSPRRRPRPHRLLHVDGLVDSADGLFPHLPVERRLEVMAEPTRSAPTASPSPPVVLLLRFAALASMAPAVLLVAGAWCGSRTVMAVTARAVPYARPGGGLATAMLGGDWRPVGVYGVVTAVTLGGLGGGWRTAVAVAVGMVAAGGVVLFGRRPLGDSPVTSSEAAGVVGETVALIVAAAKW